VKYKHLQVPWDTVHVTLSAEPYDGIVNFPAAVMPSFSGSNDSIGSKRSHDSMSTISVGDDHLRKKLRASKGDDSIADGASDASDTSETVGANTEKEGNNVNGNVGDLITNVEPSRAFLLIIGKDMINMSVSVFLKHYFFLNHLKRKYEKTYNPSLFCFLFHSG
jgi:hypothetical protein